MNTQTADRFYGTKLPWIEHTFRLISWWEMNEFSADGFLKIGTLLGNLVQALDHEEKQFTNLNGNNLFDWLSLIHNACLEISLDQSWRSAKRIMVEFKAPGIHRRELKIRLNELQKLIFSEMQAQLFLWVPSYRAEFYSKDAESMIGAECCTRFASIQREVEEASKCYAVGRYTACAFHLMRSTEAGVKALAKAIKFSAPHDQWDLVFKKLKSEASLKPSLRPAHWQSHGDFIETVWADMRTISKAWRNDTMHLVDVYGEEDAKTFLTVIPLFLRHLATKVDENGMLY